MANPFDHDEAIKFLHERQEREKKKNELTQRALLEKTRNTLAKEFQRSTIEVFLVGSILRPYQFKGSSDIDIVVKNFTGDRFSL